MYLSVRELVYVFKEELGVVRLNIWANSFKAKGTEELKVESKIFVYLWHWKSGDKSDKVSLEILKNRFSAQEISPLLNRKKCWYLRNCLKFFNFVHKSPVYRKQFFGVTTALYTEQNILKGQFIIRYSDSGMDIWHQATGLLLDIQGTVHQLSANKTYNFKRLVGGSRLKKQLRACILIYK